MRRLIACLLVLIVMAAPLLAVTHPYSVLGMHGEHMLLETTFERLLRGTLDTKTSTPVTVTYNFGSDATDNNGVATWSGGSWGSAATYRSNNNAAGGDYVEWVFRTAGTNNIVLDHGGGVFLFDGAVGVTLDSVAKPAWDQATNQTYTLASVAAGVHTLRLTKGATATVLHISTLQFSALPYQGVGVAGDAFTVVLGAPWVLAHTLGIGPTAPTGTNYNTIYGSALTPRLPMGSADNSTTLARAYLWGTNKPMHRARLTGWGTTGATLFYAGAALSLSATAGTRGFRVIPTNPLVAEGEDNPTSAIHEVVWAALVRITTAGAGSQFAVGDLALFVYNRSYATTGTANFAVTGDYTVTAGDLFKIPSDLL